MRWETSFDSNVEFARVTKLVYKLVYKTISFVPKLRGTLIARPSEKSKELPRSKDVLLLVAFVAVILLGVYWILPRAAAKRIPLRMTAGDASGLRHAIAVELAQDASKYGLEIEVVSTEGSGSAIGRLARREFDCALIQGGLVCEEDSPIRQVSALHIEPLHLLVRAELHSQMGTRGFSALKGKRVNLGAIGGGTHPLAELALAFAGLESASENPKAYRPTTMTYAELEHANEEELPDAIFTVSSMPSPIADLLNERFGYKLVEIPFGEALSLEAFLELGKPKSQGVVDRRHIYSTTIPAYTYSFERMEPREPLRTIGTRLLFVANDRVAPEIVERLLDALYQSKFAHMQMPVLDATLLDLPPEYPMHLGAERYKMRSKPLIAGDAIDYVEKLLAIIATLTGGSFVLIQWFIRRAKRRREIEFARYIERVNTIERESLSNEMAAQLDLAELIRLQRELADVKSDVVSKFASGELDIASSIHGFLSLINDTRDQLTRLILHQRDTIEAIAEQQHVRSDTIWNQQLGQPSVDAPSDAASDPLLE